VLLTAVCGAAVIAAAVGRSSGQALVAGALGSVPSWHAQPNSPARADGGLAPPNYLGSKIAQIDGFERSSLAAIARGKKGPASQKLRSAQKELSMCKAELDEFRTAGTGANAGAIAQELGASDSLPGIEEIESALGAGIAGNTKALGFLKKGRRSLTVAASYVRRVDAQVRTAQTTIGQLKATISLGYDAAYQSPSSVFGPNFTDIGVRGQQDATGVYIYFGQAAVTDYSKAAVIGNNFFQPVDCKLVVKRFLECVTPIAAGRGLVVSVSPPMSAGVIDITSSKGVQRILWGTY
jgi:hypothetical protein